MLDESLALLRRLLEEDGPVTPRGPGVPPSATSSSTPAPCSRTDPGLGRRLVAAPAAAARAARYEGVVPLWPGFALPHARGVRRVPGRDPGGARRAGRDDAPFDALVWSRTDGPDDDRPLAYPEAGATWWVEAFHPRSDSLDDVRRRIAAGPPRTGPATGAGPRASPRLPPMTDPADDQARLSGYVDVWWQAVTDFTALLEELPAEAVGDADRPARAGTCTPWPRTPPTSRRSSPARPRTRRRPSRAATCAG